MEKEGNNLFQVNLKGMIALLSEHIYSNPNTFVRELLQNCVDAITALRNIDEKSIDSVLEKVFKAIHQASIDRQTKVMNE